MAASLGRDRPSPKVGWPRSGAAPVKPRLDTPLVQPGLFGLVTILLLHNPTATVLLAILLLSGCSTQEKPLDPITRWCCIWPPLSFCPMQCTGLNPSASCIAWQAGSAFDAISESYVVQLPLVDKPRKVACQPWHCLGSRCPNNCQWHCVQPSGPLGCGSGCTQRIVPSPVPSVELLEPSARPNSDRVPD